MLKHQPSILVVDDDVGVCETIQSLLDDEGFTVAAAATGWEALDLLAVRQFDLAVVDVRLGGAFDGVDFVRRARAEQPRLRALFISGYDHRATDDPDRDDFVSKPFRPSELLGCVWELLQRKVPERASGIPQLHAERVILAAKIDCMRNRRNHAAAECESTDAGFVERDAAK